ncbi:MAG: hypothetical protein AseanaTS_31270 [Candidatus Pelagadaptatus aseana]
MTVQQLQCCESNPKAFDALLADIEPGLLDLYIQIRQFDQSLRQDDCESPANLTVDRFFHTGIPGRKWQQIKAFAAQVDTVEPILDWCSGKGHLARLLAVSQQVEVDCLEFDQGLCDAGAKMAMDQELPLSFHCHDVLKPLPAALHQKAHYSTALHACGNLHLAVIQHAVKHSISGLSVSPCCYHKVPEQVYMPLSAIGKNSGLQLTRDDLALSVAETVTGGNRDRLAREKERLWRLGFDLLQRQVRGVDEYLAVPSVPKSRLAGDFQSFCDWCFTKKGVAAPSSSIAVERYLEQAQTVLIDIRKFELIHQPFKRAIELWLILDRCLYLQDNGFKVGLTAFCDRQLTPRNLLINAQRHQHSPAI